MNKSNCEADLPPFVFVDDAHTFGGAQIALAWAIRAILHRFPQPIVCICTQPIQEAIQKITGADDKLRFVECPPALSLNLFRFPVRLRIFYKLLSPIVREGAFVWWLNLSGIEFCLAPLLILRLLRVRPSAWLHNSRTLLFYNANTSTSRRLLSKLRDAVSNKFLFRLYRLIVTPSCATEGELKIRFRGGIPPSTGFLHPHVGLLDSRDGLRTEIGTSADGGANIWMIGRLDFAHKNNLVALEVLQLLRARGRSARLTVVGDGPDMASFRSSAYERDLSGLITFEGWKKDPWKSVPNDAVVLIPSSFEAMPMVATEAMLRGIRMVTSPIPAFEEGSPRQVISASMSPQDFACKVEEISAIPRESIIALYVEALKKFTEEAFAEKFSYLLKVATTERS
jgi:glycosyltransferase involved in cell wall biosynthesis